MLLLLSVKLNWGKKSQMEKSTALFIHINTYSSWAKHGLVHMESSVILYESYVYCKLSSDLCTSSFNFCCLRIGAVVVKGAHVLFLFPLVYFRKIVNCEHPRIIYCEKQWKTLIYERGKSFCKADRWIKFAIIILYKQKQKNSSQGFLLLTWLWDKWGVGWYSVWKC